MAKKQSRSKTEEKPRLSPSRIVRYCKCPESYRRAYVEREHIPPGIVMLKGTSVHFGAKYNFRQKIKSRKDLKTKIIINHSISNYESNIKHRNFSLTSKEKSTGRRKTIGQAKDSIVRMSEVFGKEVAPRYQPKLVEHQHLVRLPNCSHDLLGVLDLVDRKGNIMDIKTSSKSKNQAEIDSAIPLSVYALLYKAIYGKQPKGIFIENIVDASQTKRNFIKTKRGRADFIALINRINSVLAGINAGYFPPCEPTSWWCDPRYCGYHLSCPYVNSINKSIFI